MAAILLNLDGGQTLHEKTVVCIGFFDGVHRGHARLIDCAREVALTAALKVCVHTFVEMPAKVLRPDDPPLEITPLAEKIVLLGRLGVDIVAVSAFNQAMAHMRAADFFRDMLIEKLRAVHIVAGFHHRFGYQSEGDAKSLAALCKRFGAGLSIVPPVCTAQGELISSTAIRQAILAGDRALAEEMLGRPCAPR